VDCLLSDGLQTKSLSQEGGHATLLDFLRSGAGGPEGEDEFVDVSVLLGDIGKQAKVEEMFG